jgi:hypothetical protein
MIQKHKANEESGMLASQKFGAYQGTALAPANLAPAPADGSVRVGDVVMLSAAMGGVLGYDTMTKADAAYEAYTVTRTSEEGGMACTRTAWRITVKGDAPEDGLLRFGMPFALSCETEQGTLYLQSMRYTLTNLNYGGSGGGKTRVTAVPTLNQDSLWTTVALDPSDLVQFESQGMPVPANTFVALKHLNTQELLFTDDDAVRNKFVGEREVSAKTDAPILKNKWGSRTSTAVGVGNHWAFTTAEAGAAPPQTDA